MFAPPQPPWEVLATGRPGYGIGHCQAGLLCTAWGLVPASWALGRHGLRPQWKKVSPKHGTDLLGLSLPLVGTNFSRR